MVGKRKGFFIFFHFLIAKRFVISDFFSNFA